MPGEFERGGRESQRGAPGRRVASRLRGYGDVGGDGSALDADSLGLVSGKATRS